MEKPEFVLDFERPKNTEIKHINGKWYLYERINVYDAELKRSRKKSGKILGRITEDGFVPSKSRSKNSESKLNDVVESGGISFLYSRTEDMRKRLEMFFPDCWKMIYSIVLLRVLYDNRFRRLQLNYEDSILSYIYPELSFNSKNIAEFIADLGRRRNTIAAYMEDSLNKDKSFIMFDGHRILSASRNMDNAEKGYDSKRRYRPQANLVYMYAMDENIGLPAYYKQFKGSTPDVTAFVDILNESHVYGSDCTVVADKGCGSDEDFNLLTEAGLKYVIPLKRGNQYVKGKVPPAPAFYDYAFTYEDRSIQSIKIEEDGFNVFLFCDSSLYAEEMADLTSRTEKKNNTAMLIKGKGRLTDEQLDELKEISLSAMLENKEEIGTITIKTTRTDLDSVKVYNIYKQRQNIEQFFKTYSDSMELDSSYMHDNYGEEAWLFLNHLSSIIGVSLIAEIDEAGESKNISLKDLIRTLTKIKVNISSDGDWNTVPVKRSVQSLCSKMNFDPTDLVQLKKVCDNR